VRRKREGDLIESAHPLEKQIHPGSLEDVDMMHRILHPHRDVEVSVMDHL
jgi:hypothetical protein